MNDLSLSLRLAARDWRAGELRLLIAALVIAVAAIASVGLFVDRMRTALSLQARQLLGADLVLAAGREPDAALLREASSASLAVVRTVSFPSMALAGERSILVSLKAVEQGYPLRGAIRVATQPGAPDAPAESIPARGEAWVDASLLSPLEINVGDRIELGDRSFRVTRLVTLEPDRGASFVNFAPRVLIALDDLAATGLVQPASRVSWRLLVAGSAEAVGRFEQRVREFASQNLRIETVDNGRPELGATLNRAERFLSLVALLTVLIAAVAIALGARRFAERHLDGCAVMKAAGLGQRRLVRLLLLELLWVGIVGGLVGAALGAVFQQFLADAVAPMLGVRLPAPGWMPFAQALITGLILLLGFGGWPVLRLAGVPPLRVLRREYAPARANLWGAVVVAVLAFSTLLAWLAGDRQLALIAAGGFALATLMFIAVSALAVWVVTLIRRVGPVARRPLLRLSIASWSRRRALAIAQTAALSAGIMALLLLTITRTDLIDAWRRASPPDAPNRFIINIQPDQREAVEQALAAGRIAADLQPMVRGRLIEVNGKDATQHVPAGERAQRLVEREFNLSYGSQPPAHNTVVAGRWFDASAMEVSAELGILKTLGLKMGDTVVFDVAGERVEVRITSVRKLAWDSMRANFFMILSPAALDDRPTTFLTAFHLPAASPALDRQLVRRFPNLTVFDTGHLVRQVQLMLDQVVAAVQFLFVLTLAAGLTVLWGALLSSRDERIREAALMRSLGASSRFLSRAQHAELAFGGALAGLLGAVGAIAVGWTLAEVIFEFDYQPRWQVIPMAMAATAFLTVLAGWLGLRGVLRAPVRTSLSS
ncbi:MAG: ABC transporter permease [Burkholderiaceae bacterium]